MATTRQEITRSLREWDGESGFIVDWFITGFFNAGVHHFGEPELFEKKFSDHWETDWLTAFGGETGIRDIPEQLGIAPIDWLPVRCDDYMPNLSLPRLREIYSELDAEMARVDLSDIQWYALAILDSDRDRDVDLVFSVWDGTRLFVNGERVFDEHSWHHDIIDRERLTIHLKKGRNTLLFKNEREGLIARLEEPDGSATDGITVITTAEPPKPNPVSGLAQIKRLALSLSVEMPFTGDTPEQLSEWQAAFHPVYTRSMGRTPPSVTVNRETVRIVKEIRHDGVTRRTVRIPTEAGGEFDACVLIPDDETRNGKTIITPHGHGMRFHTIIGEMKPLPPRGNQVGRFMGDYTFQLAKKGFVTAAWNERAFDERNDLPGKPHACSIIDRAARIAGYTLLRLNIEDLHRLADYVSTIDGVNGDRIGLTGLSGGATTSWLAGAFDDRFKAIASFCGLFRFIDHVYNGGCGMQDPLNVFPAGDTPEILSLIAPRPLLIAQGKQDATFNIVRAKSIYRDTLRAYQAAGVPENIELYLYDMAHQLDYDHAAVFFEKHL